MLQVTSAALLTVTVVPVELPVMLPIFRFVTEVAIAAVAVAIGVSFCTTVRTP